jgi:hypothetical protein
MKISPFWVPNWRAHPFRKNVVFSATAEKTAWTDACDFFKGVHERGLEDSELGLSSFSELSHNRPASPARFSLKWSILYKRRSRGRLRSTRPRAPFRGLGFQVALLAPLRRSFRRFPSSLSELHFGLRLVANLAPCNTVSTLRTHQRNQLV